MVQRKYSPFQLKKRLWHSAKKKPNTKATWCVIPFRRNTPDRRIQRQEVQEALPGEREGSDCRGVRFFGARVTKMFWNQVTRMAVQHCDYSENHWIVHFKERALRYVNYTATFENQWIRSRVCRLPFFGHGGPQRTGCVSLVGMRLQSTTPQFCCVSEHTEKSGNHKLHAGIGMPQLWAMKNLILTHPPTATYEWSRAQWDP